FPVIETDLDHRLRHLAHHCCDAPVLRATRLFVPGRDQVTLLQVLDRPSSDRGSRREAFVHDDQVELSDFTGIDQSVAPCALSAPGPDRSVLVDDLVQAGSAVSQCLHTGHHHVLVLVLLPRSLVDTDLQVRCHLLDLVGRLLQQLFPVCDHQRAPCPVFAHLEDQVAEHNRVVRDDVVTGDQIQPVTRRHGDAAGDVTTHQINGHYGPAGLKLPRPLRFGTLAPGTERVDTARQEDVDRPAVL